MAACRHKARCFKKAGLTNPGGSAEAHRLNTGLEISTGNNKRSGVKTKNFAGRDAGGMNKQPTPCGIDIMDFNRK